MEIQKGSDLPSGNYTAQDHNKSTVEDLQVLPDIPDF